MRSPFQAGQRTRRRPPAIPATCAILGTEPREIARVPKKKDQLDVTATLPLDDTDSLRRQVLSSAIAEARRPMLVVVVGADVGELPSVIVGDADGATLGDADGA